MADEIKSQELVAEFVGTYLLIFTVGCNVMCQTPVWAGVSIACVLMVAIYAFGGISGANFNPAVSFSLGLARSMGGITDKDGQMGMDWKKVGVYIGVQLAAALIAGLSYLALFQNSFNLMPAKGFGILSAGFCELLYTLMLCFVVLNVAVAKNGPCPNDYYGLAIGFVVVAGAYGAGNVSGGCFNPAVAFGIDVSSAFLGIGWFLVYWIFEFAGAALAVVLFKLVRPTEFEGGSEPTLVTKCISEFLGTFFLVLTVGLNVLGKSMAGAFSIAAALMCMIYALGDVSGAHFNPAVTLAIYITKMCPLEGKDVGAYMGSQILGGVVAAFAYAFIYHGASFPLGPGPSYEWHQVAIAEIVFTAVLCLVVLCVADDKKPTHSKTMFGLAIGSCVTVGGFAIGGISGGSLNPAVSFGIASSQILNGGVFYKALIYSAFEFVGAAAAAGVVMVTTQKEEAASNNAAQKSL